MDETKLAELIRSVVRDEFQSINTNINTRFDKLNDRAEGIESELKVINENIQNVLVECRSDTKQAESIQKRQQRVIEMLSSRTVENEADIRLVQDEVEVIKENLPKA